MQYVCLSTIVLLSIGRGNGGGNVRWGISSPASRVVRCRIIARDCKFVYLVTCLFDSNENAIRGKVPVGIS